MTADPRVDAYIAAAQPFARPILTELRGLIHRAVPGLDEAIKWQMPHFVLGGRNLAGLAGFKAHCALVIHGDGRQGMARDGAMGQYGKIRSMADLPAEAELTARLRAAAARLTSGEKAPRPPRVPRPEAEVPADLAAALAGNDAAQAAWGRFAPSHRREYLEWITGAKRAETRERRLAEAIAWIAEGRPQNWKYLKK